MKITNFFLFSLLSFFILLGCQEHLARRPIQQSSGSFLKESVERNKKLIAYEEALIDSIILKTPEKHFIASSKGYWYCYETKITDTLHLKTPKKGDVVLFDYEITDLVGNIIYTTQELQTQKYAVDQEEIISGLRDGIKLMKKGETISFLFPSHMAYGYHGDNKKIGHNIPIICIVTLKDIKNKSINL